MNYTREKHTILLWCSLIKEKIGKYFSVTVSPIPVSVLSKDRKKYFYFPHYFLLHPAGWIISTQIWWNDVQTLGLVEMGKKK